MSRPAARDPAALAGQRLEQLRHEIDKVNEEILRAVERRGTLVMRVLELKRELGAPVVDPPREVEMLARLAALVRGPFSRADIQRIFQTIVVASRSLQERLRSDDKP